MLTKVIELCQLKLSFLYRYEWQSKVSLLKELLYFDKASGKDLFTLLYINCSGYVRFSNLMLGQPSRKFGDYFYEIPSLHNID